MPTAIFKVIWDRKRGRPMIPEKLSSVEDEKVDGKEVQLRHEDKGENKGGYSVVGDLTKQLEKGDIVEVQIEAPQETIDAMKAEKGEIEINSAMIKRYDFVKDILLQEAEAEPLIRK